MSRSIRSACQASFRKRFSPQKYAVALFFLLLLALGFLLHKDYGISWDENTERKTGLLSLHCAANPEKLSWPVPLRMIGGDCFYGMGFQHLLLGSENLFIGYDTWSKPDGDHDIWALRHLLTFVFMWCGLIALYFSGRLLWRRPLFALIPVILFLLIPRFWAESFYNCKDMTCLAAVMIAGYFLLRVIKRPRLGNVLLCGLATAFAASTRLIGGVLFIAGVVALLNVSGLGAAKRLQLFLAFAAVSALALILFYPIGWSSPQEFFVQAIQYMRNHPWNGKVLFFGKEYLASQVPWYYVPGWMAVTLPVPLLLLFFVGHLRIVPNIFSQDRKRGPAFLRRSNILFAAFLYLSLAAVMFGGRTFYNGWRQFYFLAWPLLFIAAEGVLVLLRAKQRAAIRRTAKVVLTAWILSTLVWMVYVHPYQDLFFNILAGAPNKRFELDYWQVSSRDALRYIVGRAAGSPGAVTVARNETNRHSMYALSDAERSCIAIVPEEDFCRYFIYHSYQQWHPELGTRPFLVDFPTKVQVAHEVNIRTSLFLHPVFVYRIYEFLPAAEEQRKGGHHE